MVVPSQVWDSFIQKCSWLSWFWVEGLSVLVALKLLVSVDFVLLSMAEYPPETVDSLMLVRSGQKSSFKPLLPFEVLSIGDASFLIAKSACYVPSVRNNVACFENSCTMNKVT